MIRKKWISALALLMALLCLTASAATTPQEYEAARDMMNAGKYREAADAFAAVGDYSDAAQYLVYCQALDTAASGNYTAAVALLNSLGDFEQAAQWAVYYAALQCEADAQYEQARNLLLTLPDFRDASQRMAAYDEKILDRDYQAAEEAERLGQPERTLAGFQALGDYKDSQERARDIEESLERSGQRREAALRLTYDLAVEALNAQQAEAALAGFLSLGDYEDAPDLAHKAQELLDAQTAEKARQQEAEQVRAHQEAVAEAAKVYAMTEIALDAGDLETALSCFHLLDQNKDFLAEIQDPQVIAEARAAVLELLREQQQAQDYENAVKLRLEGLLEQARDAFAALGDYQDSAEQAAQLNVEIAAEAEAAAQAQAEAAIAELYAAIENAVSCGDTEAALAGFQSLGDYLNAHDLAHKAQELLETQAAEKARQHEEELAQAYQTAVTLREQGELTQARDAFAALGDYRDSAEQVLQIDAQITEKANAAAYARAEAARQKDDLETAWKLFADLGDYRDSAEQAERLRLPAGYQQAMRLVRENKLEQAYQCLIGLENYEDSAERAALLRAALLDDRYSLNEDVILYRLDKRWGLINLKEKIITEPLWAELEKEMKAGLIRAMRGGLCGAVNDKGQEVIPCVWKSIGTFDEYGQVLVCSTASLYGRLDSTGSEITPPIYKTLDEYVYGLSTGQLPSGAWQILDTQGKLIYASSEKTQELYAQALELMENKEYAQAYTLFTALGNYQDAAAQSRAIYRRIFGEYRVENIPGSSGFDYNSGVYRATNKMGDSLCVVIFTSRTGKLILEFNGGYAEITALDSYAFEGGQVRLYSSSEPAKIVVPDENEHFLCVRCPAGSGVSFSIRFE